MIECKKLNFQRSHHFRSFPRQTPDANAIYPGFLLFRQQARSIWGNVRLLSLLRLTFSKLSFTANRWLSFYRETSTTNFLLICPSVVNHAMSHVRGRGSSFVLDYLFNLFKEQILRFFFHSKILSTFDWSRDWQMKWGKSEREGI